MDQTTNLEGTGNTKGNGSSNGSTYTPGDMTAARDRLMSDLKKTISDAEQWLRGAANSEEIGEARAKMQETLRSAKTNLLTLEDSVIARTKLAAQATDTYVHDNPWKAVIVGGVVGLLLGVIVSRD
ncbi:YqjD family protein [Massilia sp. YMA4]|uniref:DUF883 domain-containing protein n=1 Tax=[Empedobacter] haloabium TaxID=592317 RepID=A0ABZ1UQ81_9BURK|nr:DUF883 domain-containing protein [Massilia sp. YMA4]